MTIIFMFVAGAAIGGGLGSTLVPQKYLFASIIYHSFCYGAIIWDRGWNLEALLYCLVFTILFLISIFDIQFYIIHPKLLFILFILSVIHLLLVKENYMEYIVGFFAVSGFLCLFLLLFRTGVMGGGDIKFLAVTGLLMGLRWIITAFCVSCVITLASWVLRRLKGNIEREIAMSPYFTGGIILTLLWGEEIVRVFWK